MAGGEGRRRSSSTRDPNAGGAVGGKPPRSVADHRKRKRWKGGRASKSWTAWGPEGGLTGCGRSQVAASAQSFLLRAPGGGIGVGDGGRQEGVAEQGKAHVHRRQAAPVRHVLRKWEGKRAGSGCDADGTEPQTAVEGCWCERRPGRVRGEARYDGRDAGAEVASARAPHPHPDATRHCFPSSSAGTMTCSPPSPSPPRRRDREAKVGANVRVEQRCGHRARARAATRAGLRDAAAGVWGRGARPQT